MPESGFRKPHRLFCSTLPYFCCKTPLTCSISREDAASLSHQSRPQPVPEGPLRQDGKQTRWICSIPELICSITLEECCKYRTICSTLSLFCSISSGECCKFRDEDEDFTLTCSILGSDGDTDPGFCSMEPGCCSIDSGFCSKMGAGCCKSAEADLPDGFAELAQGGDRSRVVLFCQTTPPTPKPSPRPSPSLPSTPGRGRPHPARIQAVSLLSRGWTGGWERRAGVVRAR